MRICTGENALSYYSGENALEKHEMKCYNALDYVKCTCRNALGKTHCPIILLCSGVGALPKYFALGRLLVLGETSANLHGETHCPITWGKRIRKTRNEMRYNALDYVEMHIT